MGFRDDRAKLKPLPVGNSGWEDFSQDCYTVDKTLLIKELIDDKTSVALFTRPRRFGKTTTLRMLKAFFEKTPRDTSYLFADKKIWSAGERYRDEQGKYPVIYLTFKDVGGETFDAALESLRMVIARMIGAHREALPFCDNPEDAARLDRIWHERGSVKETSSALGLLAKAIHLSGRSQDGTSVKPIVLIDEYDAPVNNASANGYLDEMTAFLRGFLSEALKDGEHVKMGVLTGVLRVAKEGILSGLNNLDVWTVFDANYNSYFGFTEDEVEEMARYYGVPEKMSEIKAWYDGYNFAGAEMYNPWSVLKYFKGRCTPKPYWLDTSSNDVIMDIVRDLPHDTAATLESLMRDGRALVPMTQELGPYAQIRNNAATLYALLASSGYLNVASPAEGEDVPDGHAWVTIPNREIEKVFVSDIVDKVRTYTGHGESDAIAGAIVRRDPQAFREAIQRFLVESVSFFDGAAEGFFHGMTLGFLAVLRDRYQVRSNRESGGGRYDIALFPIVREFPGVLIEIKAARTERDDLGMLAQEARLQIDAKNYAAEMAANGVGEVMKLGLAFFKKKVVLCEHVG